jgi:hypothetical protein
MAKKSSMGFDIKVDPEATIRSGGNIQSVFKNMAGGSPELVEPQDPFVSAVLSLEDGAEEGFLKRIKAYTPLDGTPDEEGDNTGISDMTFTKESQLDYSGRSNASAISSSLADLNKNMAPKAPGETVLRPNVDVVIGMADGVTEIDTSGREMFQDPNLPFRLTEEGKRQDFLRRNIVDNKDANLDIEGAFSTPLAGERYLRKVQDLVEKLGVYTSDDRDRLESMLTTIEDPEDRSRITGILMELDAYSKNPKKYVRDFKNVIRDNKKYERRKREFLEAADRRIYEAKYGSTY